MTKIYVVTQTNGKNITSDTYELSKYIMCGI